MPRIGSESNLAHPSISFSIEHLQEALDRPFAAAPILLTDLRGGAGEHGAEDVANLGAAIHIVVEAPATRRLAERSRGEPHQSSLDGRRTIWQRNRDVARVGVGGEHLGAHLRSRERRAAAEEKQRRKHGDGAHCLGSSGGNARSRD
jgi:hypothetical protein